MILNLSSCLSSLSLSLACKNEDLNGGLNDCNRKEPPLVATYTVTTELLEIIFFSPTKRTM